MQGQYDLGTVPGGLPLLGHAWQLRTAPLEFFKALRSFGDIAAARLGTEPLYVVNHPDLVHEVLVKQARRFNKGIHFEKARAFAGQGLVTSDEPLHLAQRRLVQPAFHRRRVATYVDRMSMIAAEQVSRWEDGQLLAFDAECDAYARKVLCDALFSADLDGSIAAQVAQSIPVLMAGVTKRVAAPLGLLERLPTRNNLRFDTARSSLRAVMSTVIKDYRRTGTTPGDLMSMLLQATNEETGQPMTDQQIHDEVITLLIAGTETAAATLSWAGSLLANHLDALTAIRAEVQEQLGDQPVNYDNLALLPFTRRVLSETLRLYPPGWLISRRAAQDLSVGGHHMLAGSHVFVCTYALHRDGTLYPSPDRFDPLRWAADTDRSARNGTFVPFGGGMRSCLGEGFAWAEMTIFLAEVIRRWNLRTATHRPPRPVAKFSLRLDALPVTVERA